MTDKGICAIKLFSFKSMCSQPHIENWDSHLSEEREASYRAWDTWGMERMAVYSGQDSMITVSKHSEGNKKVGGTA